MTIKFMDDEHEINYYKVLCKMTRFDAYHHALAYLLTLDKICRQHVNEIFDFEDDCIKSDSLNACWQTSSGIRITRLAFKLCYGCRFDSFDTYEYFLELQLFLANIENLRKGEEK